MREYKRSDRRDAAIEDFRAQPVPLRLHCGVQHYAWGDAHYIPHLLGIDNIESQPFAELWMGAHQDLPSRALVGSEQIELDELIERAAPEILGSQVARVHGNRLPYLFKVLSAACPLSIQTHPNAEQARAGYAREEAAGISLAAGERSYKDENHKPELIVALTRLSALRGFRPLEEIALVLEEVPEFHALMPDFRPEPASLRKLYESFMSQPQEQVDTVLDPLLSRLAEQHAQVPFRKDSPEYWTLRADREFASEGHHDRGLLSIWLLNLVLLEPGQALFLSAGVLHAYLEGAGMEIMANSNNVLRGGLTAKHVNVPELLRLVRFEGAAPEILEGRRPGDSREWVYSTSASEFELCRIELLPGSPYFKGRDHSADVLIVVEADEAGPVSISSGMSSLDLALGNVCLVPASLEYRLCSDAPATIYKATVPQRAPVGDEGV